MSSYAENLPLKSYRDLIVWQKSINLVVIIYTLTRDFPKEEIYGLSSQLRRAAVSIPSNIAEGRYRGSKKDFIRFLRIAFASGAEIETQIEIAKRLEKMKNLNFKTVQSLLSEIMRMLNAIIKKLES